MGWISFDNFETGGTLGDIPVQAIPPNVFTYALNVKISDGAVEPSPGVSNFPYVLNSFAWHLLSARDNNGIPHLFVAGDAIQAFIGGAFVDVSRAIGGSYQSTEDVQWTSGVLHGIPFLNNGFDVPQSWNSTSSLFEDLPNWGANTICTSLRAHKNFMIAMNIMRSGNPYPHNIMWSAPADPGSVPHTWDYTDPTNDSGEVPLSDTGGFIVDGLTLGDAFAVYKDDATHLMRTVEGAFIFKTRLVLSESGVMAPNCIAAVKSRHIVLTKDDVIAFDGTSAESLLSRKWRRNLFSRLSLSSVSRAFVTALPGMTEVWVCVPTTDESPPDLAYVWNWSNNTWTIRDLYGVQHIAQAYASASSDMSWESEDGSWDDVSETWRAESQFSQITLQARPSDEVLRQLSPAPRVLGQSMRSVLEHLSFDFGNKEDQSVAGRIKHVSKVRPRVTADIGTALYIEVGTQMALSDSIEWTDKLTFVVGQQEDVCMSVNGRYISWRISNKTESYWRLESLDFLVNVGGVV